MIAVIRMRCKECGALIKDNMIPYCNDCRDRISFEDRMFMEDFNMQEDE